MLFYEEEKISKRNSLLNASQRKMVVFLGGKNFSLIIQKVDYLYNPRQEKPFFFFSANLNVETLRRNSGLH